MERDLNFIDMANNGKKFNVVLMNPPYANGLHLQFLKKCSVIADKIVSIQPCVWLFVKSTQKRTREVRELVDKHYTICNVYENTSELFDDAASKTKLCILYIDMKREDSTLVVNGLMSRKNDIYHSIDDVKIFGQDPVWNSLYKKICLDKSPKLETHAHVYSDLPRIIAYFQKVGHVVERGSHELDGKWVVNHGTMGGHINKEDFHTAIGKSAVPKKFEDCSDNLKVFYIFDTMQEAENFIEYMKTDFVRSILYMKKIGNENIATDQYAPWLDFRERWNDTNLFKKFVISREEQEAMRKALPDYYGIRKLSIASGHRGFLDV